MKFITNSFSIQMVPEGATVKIEIPKFEEKRRLFSDIRVIDRLCPVPKISRLWKWCIGHADTSAVVSDILRIKDPSANRVNIELKKGDTLLVAQVTGGRLPEGSTTLPEGIKIKFYTVRIIDDPTYIDEPVVNKDSSKLEELRQGLLNGNLQEVACGIWGVPE